LSKEAILMAFVTPNLLIKPNPNYKPKSPPSNLSVCFRLLHLHDSPLTRRTRLQQSNNGRTIGVVISPKLYHTQAVVILIQDHHPQEDNDGILYFGPIKASKGPAQKKEKNRTEKRQKRREPRKQRKRTQKPERGKIENNKNQTDKKKKTEEETREQGGSQRGER